MTPKISVIMAAYNNAPYLPEAIDSVLAQEGVDGIEVIVIDDASTDETPRVLESYRDRIVSLTLPTNTGGGAAPRNAGIRRAQGEYVALLDSDDVMLPGKLREQCALLEGQPDVSFCFTNFRNFKDGRDAARDFLADHARFHAMERRPLGEAWYRIPADRAFETLMLDNFIGTSGVMMRRSLIEQIGFFDEELTCGEDLEYWIRVCRGNDVAYIDREYHRRRLHPSNISSSARSLEDILGLAERLQQSPLTPTARRNLRSWLSALHFAVGYRHKIEGNRPLAIRHYLASLRFRKTNPEVLLAILKALLPVRSRSARVTP